MPEKKLRIVVVDDHALFRAGLVSLLSNYQEFQVVGEAGNGREALEVIHSQKPDVVLMDVNMPVMDGVETVTALRRESKMPVLMLTVSKRDDDLFGAIAAGADGYLLKNAEPEELHHAILDVTSGKGVLDSDVTPRILQAIVQHENPLPDAGLSEREIEVLQAMAQGKNTGAIARALFISENTVKTHVRRIFEKLDAHNRAEAVSKALQMGLIRQVY
ncbi:MAG: response regulator transcription factor [Anaerolineales bacterium]